MKKSSLKRVVLVCIGLFVICGTIYIAYKLQDSSDDDSDDDSDEDILILYDKKSKNKPKNVNCKSGNFNSENINVKDSDNLKEVREKTEELLESKHELSVSDYAETRTSYPHSYSTTIKDWFEKSDPESWIHKPYNREWNFYDRGNQINFPYVDVNLNHDSENRKKKYSKSKKKMKKETKSIENLTSENLLEQIENCENNLKRIKNVLKEINKKKVEPENRDSSGFDEMSHYKSKNEDKELNICKSNNELNICKSNNEDDETFHWKSHNEDDEIKPTQKSGDVQPTSSTKTSTPPNVTSTPPNVTSTSSKVKRELPPRIFKTCINNPMNLNCKYASEDQKKEFIARLKSGRISKKNSKFCENDINFCSNETRAMRYLRLMSKEKYVQPENKITISTKTTTKKLLVKTNSSFL